MYLAEVLPMLPAAAVLLMLISATASAQRELNVLEKIRPQPLTRPLLVIIPARNEAQRLRRTLEGLLCQHADNAQFVVFDDGSTDDTPALVREFAQKDSRLRLLDGAAIADDVPRDGFGKPIALARALHAVTRQTSVEFENILFLDADVVLEQDALGGLMVALERSEADVLSGGPRLVCQSALERMLVPAFISLVTSRHRPSRIHDPGRTDAFLNGQLILIKRAALEEAGGWRGVRHTVLEDVALACALKKLGKRIVLADLRNVASTRMYASWTEIRQGFGKNAVPLYGGTLRTMILGMASVVMAWLPWVSAGWSISTGLETTMAGGTLLLCLVMAMQATLRHLLGVAMWPVLVTPLFYPWVAFVLIEAALKGLRGGTIQWRGREYQAEAKAAGTSSTGPS